MEEYFETNKRRWNELVDIHAASEEYDLEGFLAGKNSLHRIELEKLGDVSGKKLLHLQCHFGQDTISLANLGADATGVDFSEEAIKQAQELMSELNINSEFICCNIYDLKNHLNKKFDIVFTSYGTIGWLPDIKKWANIVSHFLKPNGKFLIVEFHPFIWIFDDELKKIKYSYFYKDEPIAETFKGTYADREADIEMVEYGWNHPFSEIINSLIEEGLTINSFKEFPYSPYNCFYNMKEIGKDRFIFKNIETNFPMIYLINATKK